MNFSKALEDLRAGKIARRDSWEKDQHIAYVAGDEDAATLEHIMLTDSDGNSVPWTPSQTDILALDWNIVE